MGRLADADRGELADMSMYVVRATDDDDPPTDLWYCTDRCYAGSGRPELASWVAVYGIDGSGVEDITCAQCRRIVWCPSYGALWPPVDGSPAVPAATPQHQHAPA